MPTPVGGMHGYGGTPEQYSPHQSVLQKSHLPGDPPPRPERLGGGRIEEEVACLTTIAQCLEASFRYHSSPVPVMGGSTTSVEEASEFFELIVSLLSADSNPQRLAVLVFDLQPSILDLLVSLLEIPTPSHQLGNKAYLACRVLCIQTLTKIVSLCTDEASGAASLAERCLQHVAQTPFVRTALAHLGAASAGGSAAPLGSGSEELRVAYAECLFVLAMRAEALALVLVREGGVRAVFDCVFSDSSPMVRNYACAMLRILSERAPEQFLQLPIAEHAVRQIKVEHSKYVVILLFETLSILFYACPQIYLEGVHGDMQIMPELYTICHTFLSGNTNYDVLSSVAKLMEAMLLLESSTCGRRSSYTVRLLTQGATKVMLQRDNVSDDVKLLKVRTFRKLIQACTSSALCEHLHEAYTHFFPSLSLLINAEGSGATSMPTELRLELALCFAIILAKHPKSREYTHQTVKAYPIWIGQLRQHLLASIDEISPPVLNGCHIVDVADSYLNSIHSHPTVNWGDRVQVAQLVAVMLSEQPSAGQGAQTQHAFVEESMEAMPGQLSDMERKARLTHAILSHVIHATLAAGHGVGQPVASSNPPFLAQTPDFGRGGPIGPAVFATEGGGGGGADHSLPVQRPHQLSFDTTHQSEAFTDLQNYASSTGMKDTPSARGRSNAKRLRGIFGRSKSPASTRSTVRRPPWNSGGNSGRKALFSEPRVAKRTDFYPGNASSVNTLAHARKKPVESDIDHDYTDMAILMHLPITFGANYNRSNKPTIRRFNCGSSVPYVQQTVKSNTFQSWDVKDVGEGDLFSFFIPFHKLTEARVDEELKQLNRHKLRAKKGLVTTPQHQRGKRWFFYDMFHYVLNKTEALLRELKDLIAVHGHSNILFYLNIIRLMDSKEDGEAKALLNRSPPRASASGLEKGLLASSTAGMTADEVAREGLLQREVLKLSQGKYKDTIHGGNILYVLDRLKAYFAENFAKGEMQLSDHLRDIEDEIRKLEEKAARDVIGNEAAAEAEDDVESAYDDSEAGGGGVGVQPQPVAAPLYTPAAGGLPHHALHDEPAFSEETESDINYNLDRLRLGELDDSEADEPFRGSLSATLPAGPDQRLQMHPYSAQPRDVSPHRHRNNAAPPSHARVLAGHEWDSDSSELSF